MSRAARLTAIALALLPMAASRTQAASPAGEKPNVVYVLADDLGYGDVGCFNAESKIPTPNIDAVAKSGVRFTDAHSGSAVCTPTRYGILTGRYCWRSRLKKGVLGGYDRPLIEPGRMTVASLLRQHGYATACVGKWHLGLGWQTKDGEPGTGSAPAGRLTPESIDFAKPLTAGPHTVGFDYSFVIPASLDMAPYVYVENGRVTELPTARIGDSPRPAYWRGGPIAPSFKHETCLLELTRKAEEYLDARGKANRENAGGGGPQPFFLYLALTAPHTPHVPRPEFRGKSRAGNYGDFVVETDWTVGRVVEALKRNGLDENTLLVVTSDNGAHSEPLHLEEQYGHAANGTLRGQKSDAWDGGHRIPFVARWLGHTHPGTTCDQTICLTDLMATCAAILGTDLPNDAGEDSYNILPLLTGRVTESDPPVREATVHHSNNGDFAIRQGPWKLVLCRGSGGWSLPENQVPADAPPAQLYNLRDDPRERENLYGKRPEVVERLKDLLEKYRRDGRSVPPGGQGGGGK